MNSIISAQNLGKSYRIGHQAATHDTLRDMLMSAVRAPFNALRGGEENNRDETVWALRDISFEVQQGEIFGLIGRNGAGKSTLLKLLARITEPSAGRAEINGRVASLLEVGTGFHPELTGRENIFLNGAILGMSRREIERKFDEIVAFSEVEKYLDTPVKRYSSGMFTRLAFAVAAHLEPEILLVDEVLAVGDLAFQKKCLGKMGDVARQGRTIFFVSHNMGAISSLCGKVIYLQKGRVKSIGQTEEIVHEFLGEMLNNDITDLAQLRLPGVTREIEFTDIQLVGNGDTQLKFGESVRYELELKSTMRAAGVSIGSSIFNSSGHCVGTLFTSQNFDMERGQTRRLQIQIDNVALAPGQYYMGISVGRGGGDVARQDFDIIIGKPSFEVSPIAIENSPLAHWSSNWGDIVLKDTRLEMLS